jgi:hypothetical protein
MLFEKSYDMVLWFLVKNNSKYFENFTYILFKLIFLESSAENIENAHFNFNQISSYFVSLLLVQLWIIIFATKLRFSRNLSKPFLFKIKKIITLKLAKLVSRPIHHVKFNKLNSWKNISFDVLKFRFFFVFFQKFKFSIFDYDVEIE